MGCCGEKGGTSLCIEVEKRDSGSDIAVTGSDHTLTVTETTTYTLVAGNDYGLDDTSDPVTITVGEVPVVDTVTADYAAAPPPPEVTIAWTVTPNSVTDPTLELTRRPSTGGAAVPVAITGTDSTTDTPAAGTYIYSLIATNEFGSSTAEDATAVVVP